MFQKNVSWSAKPFIGRGHHLQSLGLFTRNSNQVQVICTLRISRHQWWLGPRIDALPPGISTRNIAPNGHHNKLEYEI